MFGLIKTAARLSVFLSMYTIIFAHIAGLIPNIVSSFTIQGMPVAVSMALLCAIRTLNWLFGSTLVNVALWVWLVLPPVKLGMYFTNKIFHM